MNRLAVAGVACTVLALAGYGLGLATPYPGRAFTLTGLMAGTVLLVIGFGQEVGA